MKRFNLIAAILIANFAFPLCGNATKSTKKTLAHPAPGSTRHACAPGPLYGHRPDTLARANEIAEHHGLDAHWTRQVLAQARYLPQVTRLVLPAGAGQKKNWAAYRSRFIDPVRIAAGVRFWQAHAGWLARAEAVYGVPPEIVVGILGVETLYGQQTGHFRVLDTLATLAFDFPAAHPRAAARQAFFQDELAQFLALMHRSGGNPLAVRGSFAGAIGLPQFMPSSIVRHAVDFDGDGTLDLAHSPADAIGSVAAYFKAFGWRPGMPTHYALRLDPAQVDLDALLAPDILPTFSVESLAARGAVVEAAGQQHAGPLALVELQMGEQAPVYVAGTENFYAITRYNWSSYYAMAVIELGQKIARLTAPKTD
jgi:membrane-bound lytic murein transglycosylase B